MCKKISKIVCFILVLFIGLLTNNFSLATPLQNNNGVGRSIIFEDPKSLSHQFSSNQKQTTISSIDSSQLGWSGPFSFNITSDSLNNLYFGAKYTKKLNERFAISGLVDYGKSLYRLGATVGMKFSSNLFKLSAERLSQVLPFNFDSGNISKRVAQNAYGFKYQQLFDSAIQTVGVGGYYANAPSKWLEPVNFSLGGLDAINERRIAGSTSKGLNVSSDVKLSELTLLTGTVYYDQVNYDKVLNNPLTPNYDESGVGGGILLNQLVSDTVKFSLGGDVRKIYDTYKASVSWRPQKLVKYGLEFTLVGARTVSHNATPSDNSIGISFSLNPELFGVQKASYQLPIAKVLSDVGVWTSAPAVHMERVLVQAEQTTELVPKLQSTKDLTPEINSMTPATGDLGGGDEIAIKGKNFAAGAKVKFGEEEAEVKSVAADKIVIITPPAKTAATVETVTVDVEVVNKNGKAGKLIGGFVYSRSASSAINKKSSEPSISSLKPNHGPASGATSVDINGNHFKGVTSVTFGKTLLVCPSENCTPVNNAHITVKSPSGVAGTKVDVRVITPNGTSPIVAADQFTYDLAVPTVTSVSPSAGPTIGGTSVTITGTNFIVGASTVNFGTKQATCTVNSATQIICSSPAQAAGTVHVTVTTAGGTSATSANDQFTYIAPLTITASAGNNGYISPSGAVPVNYGANQTFTITPAANYHIVDVIVDGDHKGAITTYTFNNVIVNHTISATFAIDTRTINASAGSNGTISPAGAVNVNYGANQTFNISASDNYQIADVLVDGVSVGAQSTYTFSNVIVNHTIAATFAIKTHTINASVSNGGGKISPSGAVAVNHGASQNFVITPNFGYHIVDVVVDSVSQGAKSTYSFTNVIADHTISVAFAIDTYVISASAGVNGIIDPAGDVAVNYGANQKFNVTANMGYHIADVLVDGISVGAVSTYEFDKVTDHHTIEAKFAINTNIITATAGSNGYITPSGAVAVNYGANQTFTMTPKANYHIANVIVDGSSVGDASTYTFDSVTSPHTISASFAINEYTIDATAGSNGSLSH